MPKPENAYQRIQRGKREAEAYVLRKVNESGEEGLTTHFFGLRHWNALDRLLKDGRLRHDKRRGHYLITPKGRRNLRGTSAGK